MVVTSILVVTRRNPVHSVVCMLILFVHIAGVYLFLNADFLAAIQIIVYAGAILVLFLFVIMLLNLRQDAAGKKFQRQWPAGLLVGIVFIVFFVLILTQMSVLAPLGKYSIEFVQSEGISLILLVAILGAVVLAKKKIS
jgi:NADH-quinone oxidoreductase subunit J